MSPLENLFSQGMVERLGWMLVHFLWQATAVTLLLAAILRLLRRVDANLRYVIGCLALGLIIVLPLITIGLVEVAEPVVEPGPLPAPAALPSTPATVEIVDEIPAFDGTLPLMAAAAVPLSWQERLVAAVEPALPYVVLGWLAGVFGLSAWHLGGWTQLQRLKRRMVRDVGVALERRLAELSERLGVCRAVRLLESAVVDVPTVVGWLRPVILLPASALTGLSTTQLEALLAHELAHIRRCDYLLNVLQTIVEILGFYHPAVWWISHRIRIERENCCDDLAVGVCGSSLQYARALTSMEEIRHRRLELALGAAGGNLMSRIARLLGRPAVDDRRFAWLPGLLALLFVIGIVIPAALALGVSEPGLLDDTTAEAPSQDAAVPADKTEEQLDTSEPPRPRILISYTIAEVFADRTLDPETATQASGLLMPIPPGKARRIRTPTVPPDTAELRKPLRDVLAKFMPAGKKGKDFADLLLSRGYARVLARPKFLLFEKEPGVITVGQEQDPNTPESQAAAKERGFGSMRLSTMARLLDERDTMMVETKLVLKYPSNETGDPNGHTTTTEINSMGLIPNDEYSAIIERAATGQNEQRERRRLHILLIQPSVARRPESNTQSLEDTRVQVVTEGGKEDDPSASPEADLLLDFTLTKAKTDLPVDRETMRRIEDILGISAQTTDEGARVRREPKITLGEVLRNHVVGKSLPPETAQALNDLLLSKGYVELLASPRVQAQEGQETRVRIGTAEYFLSGHSRNTTELEKIECGTTVAVTTHVVDSDSTTLKLAVELTDLVPGAKDADLPLVRKTVLESTITVSNGLYFSLLAESVIDQTTPTQEREAVLVMVRPSAIKPLTKLDEMRSIRLNYVTVERVKSLLPPAFQPYVEAEPIDNANPDYRGHILTVTAPQPLVEEIAAAVRRIDVPPARVLLNVHIVRMEAGGLANLGIEWGGVSKRSSAGETDDNVGRPSGVQIGCAPDQIATDSFLAALRVLQEKGQATIIANPQLVAQDGLESGLRSMMEWWLSRRRPAANGEASSQTELYKTDCGTVLSVTPHVSDHNDITLEMAIEAGDAIPPGQGRDLPVVTRRTTVSTVTVSDGGTAVVAGLMENPTGRRDRPAQEVAIFVSARVVVNTRGRSLPVPASAETVVRVPPVTDASRASRSSPVPSESMASAKEQKQTKQEIGIEARFVATGQRFLRDLRDGRPIQGLASATEVRTLHEIGKRLSQDKPLTLDDAQAGLVMKALRNYRDCSTIAAPHVTVRADEPTCVSVGNQVPYVAGYDERNGPGGEPQPRQATFDSGVKFELVARVSGPNEVECDGTLRIATLRGFDEKNYKGRYPYQVPRADEVVFPIDHAPVPSGRTVLMLGPKARLDASSELATVLIMIKPSIVESAAHVSVTLVDVLMMLAQRSNAKIGIDATVKPIPVSVGFDLTNMPVPAALQRILEGTEYQFRMVDRNTYLVFKPISQIIEGDDLRLVLEDFSVAAGVPIIPDPNVEGTVSAYIYDQPLEKALEIVLAGTPYLVKKMPDHYLVIDRNTKLRASPTFRQETRTIRLNYVTAERVKSLLPSAFQMYVKAEPAGSDNRGSIVTITAPSTLMESIIAQIRRMEVHRPRQVLLDGRVVVIERKDLLNLGITWASPTFPTSLPDGATEDPVDTNSDITARIQVGCTPDRTATDSLLATLDRLCQDGFAKSVAAPQCLAQDGRETLLCSVMEEWYFTPVLRDAIICGDLEGECELSVSILPRISSTDDILLETTLDLNKSTLERRLSDPPLCPTASSVVTIKDGGTVVWGGLTQDGSPREVAVFVTARLIPDAR